MARISYVQKAKQRYRMIPVLNADGSQKIVPVMRRDGVQKTTKTGKPVFLPLTQPDTSRPLPMPTCDLCGEKIKVGQPYKHITPRSGPYGGVTRYRCASCRPWQVWEYSYSLSAQLARIQFEYAELVDQAETPEDVGSALEEAAAAVREIAEEKEQNADNIAEGFQHETSVTEELRDVAEQLNSWADEIESATGDVPELPEPEEVECEECGGSGRVDPHMVQNAVGTEVVSTGCDECDGTGLVTPDEPTEDQIEEWRSDVVNTVTIVEDCPL